MMARAMALLLFVLISCPGSGPAEAEANGYVEVEIEYRSAFPGFLQIKDEVCRPPRLFECEKARIKLRSGSCGQKEEREECREARELLETSFCIPGLIYEGRVAQGEKIKVWLCKSSGGFGNLSVRDIEKGSSWTNYFLLNDGDRRTYP